MVSIGTRRVLRIHAGYAYASGPVCCGRSSASSTRGSRAPSAVRPNESCSPFRWRSTRRAARRGSGRSAPGPGDLLLVAPAQSGLSTGSTGEHFGGTLSAVPIRLSGRMRTRLGELSVDIRTGQPIEIAISRRHIARHRWSEVEHTLLHEMVHQWQAETGLPVDHGPLFREKARQVGVVAGAKRTPEASGGAGRRSPPSAS